MKEANKQASKGFAFAKEAAAEAADLVSKDGSVSGTAPNRPKLAKVTRDYTPSFDSAIAGQAGDIVAVIAPPSGDWVKVVSQRTQQQGFMPATYLQME